jgi:GNAT superfamily N-acetyltransferase
MAAERPEGTPDGGTLRTTDATEYGADLRALLSAMRHALKQRGEGLPPDWPETAHAEIAARRMLAWVFEGVGPTVALAILAVRRDRGFGQLHVMGPPSSAALAAPLLQQLHHRRPPSLRRVDVAFSAEPADTERSWGRFLDDPFPPSPWTVIRRHALVRALDPSSPPPEEEVQGEFRLAPSIPQGPRALGAVDFASFMGGPDAGMVAETPEDNQRLLAGLLEGDLGPPIPEASLGVFRTEGGALVGFCLQLEESPGEALLADIALLPEVRRRGLGRALLLRSLRALQALGYRRSRLWVTDANLPARALYARLGYTEERAGRILRWESSPSVPGGGP